jgi:hypothetical protein
MGSVLRSASLIGVGEIAVIYFAIEIFGVRLSVEDNDALAVVDAAGDSKRFVARKSGGWQLSAERRA